MTSLFEYFGSIFAQIVRGGGAETLDSMASDVPCGRAVSDSTDVTGLVSESRCFLL